MKTLVITGASKGIGFSVAEKFLADGARVINLSRSPAPDDRIENHAIDLSCPEVDKQINELMKSILNKGEICLIHNAAKMSNDTAQNTSTEAFRDILNINVVAPHILNQAVLPFMQPGSSVIYLGSTLSEKAVANTYSYVTSKHAVVGMMRAMCQDLAGTGIHTLCICPGFTDTEMLREHVGDNHDVLTHIAALSTFNRLITPEEIATSIHFAAHNPILNGAVVHANLGQIES